MDDSASDSKQQVIDSLRQANNILVTVKNSPTIDQLAACIGLTLILNDQGKHGTAVFSGEVPSVIEFLEPGKTLERNADSLQDFIISLDKAKADKLRYKVEDSVVRIFITPYKTSISEKDLEFGQGDFNVDVVIALGVHNQDDLDQAITSHGRILHDATVISMNTEPGGSDDLGSINWIDADRSSLSEMVADIAGSLAKDDKDGDSRRDVIDNQIATALLTGIVAETERFGNAKTTPSTMETAARLLTAGANQELVASKLAEPQKQKETEKEAEKEESHDDENDHNDNHDEHSGDEHTEERVNHQDESNQDSHDGGSKSIYEESSDVSAMPSMLNSDGQDDDEGSHKDDSTEATIDHSDDENNNEVVSADLNEPAKADSSKGNSLDIEHQPDEEVPETHHDAVDGNASELVAPMIQPEMPAFDGAATMTEPKEENDLALAHTGASFDMPAPSDQQQSAALLPTMELAPTVAPPVMPEAVAPVPANEDQADLDLLKQHNPQSASKVQPMHSAHGVYIAPPAHAVGTSVADPDAEVPSGGSSYGLTPPTMGGTLTSNSTEDHPADPMSSGASGSASAKPAMLTHSQPDFSNLPPPLEANSGQQPTPGEPQKMTGPPREKVIAPPDHGPLIAPLPENSQTLAQLEQSTNSPHLTPVDMPMPSLTPPIQQNPTMSAPSGQPSTPLPPTPPPITESLIPPLAPPAAA